VVLHLPLSDRFRMTGAEVGGAIAATAIGVGCGVIGLGKVWVGLALNRGRAEARPYIYFGEWGRKRRPRKAASTTCWILVEGH
jgi:hypothetical protein